MRTFAAVAFALFAVTVQAQTAPPAVAAQQPSVELPAELDRVLRDYENAWRARDAAALAALFTEDGFVLQSGGPAVRGRAAILEVYAKGGGPLFLRAFAYATESATGYIIGGFRSQESGPDGGKFVLALRKDAGGRWMIAADIDNANQRPQRPPQPPAAPAPQPPAAPAPPPPPVQ